MQNVNNKMINKLKYSLIRHFEYLEIVLNSGV